MQNAKRHCCQFGMRRAFSLFSLRSPLCFPCDSSLTLSPFSVHFYSLMPVSAKGGTLRLSLDESRASCLAVVGVSAEARLSYPDTIACYRTLQGLFKLGV